MSNSIVIRVIRFICHHVYSSITSFAELSEIVLAVCLHVAPMFRPFVNNASALAINRALARKIARVPNYIAFLLIDRLSR